MLIIMFARNAFDQIMKNLIKIITRESRCYQKVMVQ